MMKPITLDFRGHTARVTRVLTSHTFLSEPEGLTVVVDFAPAFNSTLSVYLTVPARRYSRGELIMVVETALRDWASTEERLKDARAKREKAEAELRALAYTLASDLGLEGPD